MRTLPPFFLFLTLTINLTVHAGHPDQDPVVKDIRQQFAHASKPSLEGLHLGKSLDCIEHAAERENDDVVHRRGMYRFHRMGNTVYNYSEETLVKAYFLQGKELQGSFLRTPFNFLDVIRVTQEGALIAEFSMAEVKPRYNPKDAKIKGLEWTEKKLMPPSLANPEYFAQAYTICFFSE